MFLVYEKPLLRKQNGDSSAHLTLSPTPLSLLLSYRPARPGSAILVARRTCVNPVLARTLRSMQRNILAGIITIGPLFVTYLIFSFMLSTLAKAGLPVIKLFAMIFPEEWLSQPWLQSIMAIVLTLVMLYVVGRVTRLVVGRQALELFETTLDRLPVVAKIYSSVRQLIDSMRAKKESNQRVVLVDFPISG